MKQVRLIEPNCFAGYRMIRNRGPHLASSQVSCVLPLKLDGRTPAIVFYSAPISGLKNSLPRKVSAIAVVAHVHDLLLDEARFDLRIEQLKHFAAVGDRRLAACDRGLRTVEPNF